MSLWSTVRAFFTAGRAVVGGLSEEAAGLDPLVLFHRWFQDAAGAGIFLPEAITLATATPDGIPSARLVLLKSYDERGFVFFTNYGSRKAMEMERNPVASLVSHWPLLQRQVRLEGHVERIPKEESEAYFQTRPRGSQIGAWASRQSETLVSRRELADRVERYEAEFKNREVPLPEFWGGYRLQPMSVEFWQGRANRLHDRIRFVRDGSGWARERLYP
jgi:pyridoxamine 5'-phosphate oxidase